MLYALRSAFRITPSRSVRPKTKLGFFAQRRQVRHLRGLEPFMLDDIGLTQADVQKEMRRNRIWSVWTSK